MSKGIFSEAINKGDRYFNAELYYYDTLRNLLEEAVGYLSDDYDDDWIETVLNEAFPNVDGDAF